MNLYKVFSIGEKQGEDKLLYYVAAENSTDVIRQAYNSNLITQLCSETLLFANTRGFTASPHSHVQAVNRQTDEEIARSRTGHVVTEYSTEREGRGN